MNLIAPPAFTDNHIWMLHDGRQAVVVDPVESAPAVAALDARELVLAAILVTHDHAEPIGGVDAHNDDGVGFPTGCHAQWAVGLPALAASIARERRVSPFLRRGESAVTHRARGTRSEEPAAVLTALRQWKNDFR